MDDESSQPCLTIEWCIENISCWNHGIHGANISHKKLVIDGSHFRLFLYPKCGPTERFMVLVHDENKSLAKLCFMSSDGSVLSELQIGEHDWDSDCEIDLWTELPFEKVVSNLVKKHSHKDVLTLKYRRRNHSEKIYCVRSQIDIVENFLEIPFERFKTFPWTDECSATLQVSVKDKYQILSFSASTDSSDSSKIIFSLELGNTDVFFIQCCVYALNLDEILLRSKKYEHEFSKKRSWDFSFTLPSDIFIKKGLCLFLRLKLVTGSKRDRFIFDSKHFKLKDPSFPKVFEGLNDISSKHPENAAAVLRKELARLYQNQEHSDFELCCRSVVFQAHKGILSARSPVFRSMLASNMKEAQSGRLEIADLDAHTLGRFLTFLYTGTVERDLHWEDALTLYYAADKYQVPSLKRKCFTVLSSTMSTTNVCHILSLADQHEDHPLTSIARDFVLDHYHEVLESEEWKSFMEKNALLFFKTITFLSEKKCLGKISEQ